MSYTAFAAWSRSHVTSVLIGGALLVAGLFTYAVTEASGARSRDSAMSGTAAPAVTASTSKPSPLIPMTADQARRSVHSAHRARAAAVPSASGSGAPFQSPR